LGILDDINKGINKVTSTVNTVNNIFNSANNAVSALLGVFDFNTANGGTSTHIPSSSAPTHQMNYMNGPTGGLTSGINGHTIEMFPEDVVYHSNLPKEMRYFNYQLFKEFVPDVNGYTLAFFVPPTFNGFPIKNQEFMNYFQKISCLSITDVVPASEQVSSDRVSNRSGGISFPIDVTPSEQISVTFIDNMNMDIFNFHLYWVLYMKESLEGLVKAPSQYLGYGSNEYGALDYVGALFIVKYDPSMSVVRYVGKAVGIFPTLMPNRESIGSRMTNEIPMLPITYQCPWYYGTCTPDGDQYGLFKQLSDLLTQY
jgi:hypothetical protein